VGLTWKSYALALRRTFVAAFRHRAFAIAKAAAYSALLSFFPVLTSAAAILVETKADFVSRAVSAFLFEVVPPGTEEIVRYQFSVKGERPVLLLIAAGVFAVWAASGVIGSLIHGFQAAYGVERGRSFFHNIAVSMALVVLSAAPLLAASGLILFGERIDGVMVTALTGDPLLTPVAFGWRLLSRLARYVVAFSAAVAVTMVLYYFGPNRRQRWSGVWRGAVLATLVGLLATSGFGWYVRNIANYNVVYKSVAASITLLVWMYLMSLIALLGCEFNAELERETSGARRQFSEVAERKG
jgi:membrane protein